MEHYTLAGWLTGLVVVSVFLGSVVSFLVWFLLNKYFRYLVWKNGGE